MPKIMNNPMAFVGQPVHIKSHGVTGTLKAVTPGGCGIICTTGDEWGVYNLDSICVTDSVYDLVQARITHDHKPINQS